MDLVVEYLLMVEVVFVVAVVEFEFVVAYLVA